MAKIASHWNSGVVIMKQTSVLVLGYGEMGHAMEYLLGTQQMTIWDKSPQKDFE